MQQRDRETGRRRPLERGPAPLAPPHRSPVFAHTAVFFFSRARSVRPSLALSDRLPLVGTHSL